jgi:hypothetical protein
MATLVNGKVVQTTETDLATYLKNKQAELARIDEQIAMLKVRQTAVITELEALVPAEV